MKEPPKDEAEDLRTVCVLSSLLSVLSLLLHGFLLESLSEYDS